MKLTFDDAKILCPELNLPWPFHLILYCRAEPNQDDPSINIFIYYRWWIYILFFVPVSFITEIFCCLYHGFKYFQIINRCVLIKHVSYYEECYKDWKKYHYII